MTQIVRITQTAEAFEVPTDGPNIRREAGPSTLTVSLSDGRTLRFQQALPDGETSLVTPEAYDFILAILQDAVPDLSSR